MDVSWGVESDGFPVDIEVRALDRKGLLKDITQVLAAEHINILRTHSHGDTSDHSVIMQIQVEVSHLGQLSHALTQISGIHNILEVHRKESQQTLN